MVCGCFWPRQQQSSTREAVEAVGVREETQQQNPGEVSASIFGTAITAGTGMLRG